MKNKVNKFTNAYLIASLCLLNTYSYGQTKEETISWLREKLEKNLIIDPSSDYISKINLELNEITPCRITISYMITGPGANGTHHYKVILPTEGAQITDGFFYYSSEKISYEKNGKATSYHSFNTANDFSIRKGEDDLRARVEKALDHLATFCPKKKETF